MIINVQITPIKTSTVKCSESSNSPASASRFVNHLMNAINSSPRSAPPRPASSPPPRNSLRGHRRYPHTPAYRSGKINNENTCSTCCESPLPLPLPLPSLPPSPLRHRRVPAPVTELLPNQHAELTNAGTTQLKIASLLQITFSKKSLPCSHSSLELKRKVRYYKKSCNFLFPNTSWRTTFNQKMSRNISSRLSFTM